MGWEIAFELEDGSSFFLPVKDIKESNPVELAENAVSAGIDCEPVFEWWVRHTLRKCDHIITEKTRYWKHTHTLGIKLP